MPFRLKTTIAPESKIELRRIIGLKPIFRRAARHSFFELGQALKKESDNQVLRTPKTGRVYFIRTRGRRRRHVSSAPGESHANRSGRLRRSIGWQVSGFNELRFGYGVGGEKLPPYAEAPWGSVEEGTKGGQMEPRPTIQNTVEAIGDRRVETDFNASLTRALKRFG